MPILLIPHCCGWWLVGTPAIHISRADVEGGGGPPRLPGASRSRTELDRGGGGEGSQRLDPKVSSEKEA